ncbi:hypothetical protein [Actinomadura sp. KC216]|uniref:hypothetical protein n=1 Tax=Actinomadura sp. KC216 TaxID=2530370 RepID=UPI0014052FA3|nr:hypothetical protein [Actinomadura sp. KC216]
MDATDPVRLAEGLREHTAGFGDARPDPSGLAERASCSWCWPAASDPPPWT